MDSLPTKESVVVSRVPASDSDYDRSEKGVHNSVEDVNSVPSSSTSQTGGVEYMTGAKLHIVTVCLLLAIFLVNFEITAVSTSLVAITNTLSHFSSASWIITAYLLTYTAFIIVWAKLSDIFGRKPVLLTALGIFVVASGACSGSKTMNQMIVFRAFQGMGGSGVYALVGIVQLEIVPTAKFAGYTALISSIFAVSLLLGPLTGGGIVNSSTTVVSGVTSHSETWRWVFLLNVPAGIVAFLFLVLVLEPKYLNRDSPDLTRRRESSQSVKSAIAETLFRVDWIGCILMLAWTLFLMAAFELAGRQDSWNSAIIISFLCVAGVIALASVAWSLFITKRDNVTEPIFPWRFFQNRVWMGMLLTSVLVGAPFTTAVVSLPLRFQTVNGVSPFDSGIRLLPFAFASPIGALTASMLCSKSRIAPVIILFGGATLATVGFALIATLPTSLEVPRAQYGYQVLAGLGTGCNIGTLIVLSPPAVDAADRAIALGAAVQFRMLGGALGLGLATSVLNSVVSSKLRDSVLTQQQLTDISNSAAAISDLPEELQMLVRQTYASGYSLQFKILLGICVAQFFTILPIIRKKALRAFQ